MHIPEISAPYKPTVSAVAGLLQKLSGNEQSLPEKRRSSRLLSTSVRRRSRRSGWSSALTPSRWLRGPLRLWLSRIGSGATSVSLLCRGLKRGASISGAGKEGAPRSLAGENLLGWVSFGGNCVYDSVGSGLDLIPVFALVRFSCSGF